MRAAIGALQSGTLAPHLRELAILRVAARRGADYEWGRHVLMAPQRGVSEALLLAARHGDGTGLPDQERAVLALADAVDEGHADDDVWATAAEALAPSELLEVLTVAGFYGMLIRITDVVELDLDDDLHDVRLDHDRWAR